MNWRQMATWLAVIAVSCLSLGAFLLRDAVWDAAQGRIGVEFSDEKTMAVSSANQIVVVSDTPGVTVTPTAGTDLVAKVSGRFSSAPELTVRAEGSTIRVELRQKPHMGFDVNSGTFEVSVPSSYAGGLQINVISGGAKVRNLSLTDLSITSSSGSVRVESVTARNSSIRVISGSITLDKYSGNLSLESASGSVTASFSTPGETIVLKSTSGNVRLLMPKNSEFTLKAKAVSGSVTCDLPLSVSQGGRNSLQGTVGRSPKTNVELTAVSGNINIRGL